MSIDLLLCGFPTVRNVDGVSYMVGPYPELDRDSVLVNPSARPGED